MQVHPSSCGTSVDVDRLEYVVKDDAQSNVNIQVDWALAVHINSSQVEDKDASSILLHGFHGSSWLTPLQAAVGVVQQDLWPTIPKNTDPKLVELLERLMENFLILDHFLSWLIILKFMLSLAGGNNTVLIEHGEGLQILHYEVGQKYKPCFDYFLDEFNTKNGGQHIATVLMYLSDVEEGGETVFPGAKGNFNAVPWWNELSQCGKEGLSVKPKMGDALLFWSMKPDAT
ncbi:hypothetical protein Vadar_013293 [Vaccinium darrowii]|uniref:Uncharacterized protein n=1 Tax=Vaccinium darrowii TaxID=229202 RepID=A0ACB7Y6E4_9ERIC|nr:hypothetical protein Vadar_013293 [Vaccinium darrowii]